MPTLLSTESLERVPLPAVLKPHTERLLLAVRDYAQAHAQEILSSVSRAGADVVSAAFSLVLVLVLPILSFYW